MERREFFKNIGLFASGFAVEEGTRLNNIKNPNFSKRYDYEIMATPKKGHITRIEFMIAHHCNLNCAYCDHFSPIAPNFFYPIDNFKKDIEKLRKITKGKIYQIVFLGGEPLLNKDIEEYIKITRKHFKNSVLLIETNGLLLNNMKDSFWKTCGDNKVKIQYTYYPLYKNYPNLKESYLKAEKYSVYLTSVPRYIFSLSRLSKNRNKDIKEIYNNCKSKLNCTTIINGTLYSCPLTAGIQFFNEYFKDYALKIDKKDYLKISEINSINEIFNFYNTPKDFCKHCGVIFPSKQIRISRKPWSQSNREVSEWYDV